MVSKEVASNPSTSLSQSISPVQSTFPVRSSGSSHHSSSSFGSSRKSGRQVGKACKLKSRRVIRAAFAVRDLVRKMEAVKARKERVAKN